MSLTIFPLAGVTIILVLAIVGLYLRIHGRSHACFPPGPKPHLLWGNIRDIPAQYDYITFREWSKEHGPVIRLSVAGKSLIILNELKPAVDLLDKRSAIYSDRPALTMLRDVVGWNWSLAMMNYGDRFKKHRKMVHRGLNIDIEHITMIYKSESRRLLQNLLEDPGSFMTLVEHWGRSMISRTIYDHDIRDSRDKYFMLPKQCERIVAHTGKPGSYLVNVFPILKHAPKWLPFFRFKRDAEPWGALVDELLELPYRLITEKIAKGTPVRCYVSNLLQRTSEESDRQVIKETAATMHVAGPTSLYSILQAFILAMTLYPDVQRKAQFELDTLLGSECMPGLEDRTRLSYINCIVSEMLRWTRSIPLGIAHVLGKDDIYNGMFIPSGSVVMANFWAISRDERLYKNPEQFLPERFLEKDTRDPRDFAFGFGRRACPGKAYADAALYLAIASILSVFDISKATDEEGREIVPAVQFTSGLVCNPQPFQCKISPRSVHAVEMIGEQGC